MPCLVLSSSGETASNRSMAVGCLVQSPILLRRCQSYCFRQLGTIDNVLAALITARHHIPEDTKNICLCLCVLVTFKRFETITE